MDLLITFLVIWLSSSIFIIATAWYISTIIKHYWPKWWRRMIVDFEPDIFPD